MTKIAKDAVPIEKNYYATRSGNASINMNESIRQSRHATHKTLQGKGRKAIDIDYIISEIKLAGLDPSIELSKVLGKDSGLDVNTKLNALTQLLRFNKNRKKDKR